MGRRPRMDYAYFGSAAEWPMVSMIASIMGVVLIFGHQAEKGVRALTGLAFDLRRFLAWLTQPWLACLAMLVVPLLLPAPGWLLTLRGAAEIESEMELARTDGYYEELTRSSSDHRKPRQVQRPADRKSFTDSGLMDEVSDYRWRVLRPNLDARWNGTTFRTGSLGYRGPDVSRRKPPGTFRVVVLGSSNTMGHGVNDEQTYARLLEGRLRDRVGPGRRVEVVNMAVSGDSPTQQLLRLQVEASGLEPDWILSDITALDFSLEEQHLRWVLGKGVEIPYDFVREALANSKVSANDSPDEFHKKLSPFLKPMLDRTLEGWASEARRIGAPLTVVILPRADSKTESPGLFQLFRELADRHGLDQVDLSHTFDRLELDEYRIAPWDHHPNALGHRLIFERLGESLLSDGAFKRRLTGSITRMNLAN
jgi:GDSL-like Lipase/Acylhydrolase family